MKGIVALISIVSFSLFSFNKSDSFDYEKAWGEVQGFIAEGRPKSALEKVDEIYSFAKKEKNTIQQVKATTYRTNLVLNTKELGLEAVITELNTRIENSASPEKQILQSLAAELIQNYYNRNRWDIGQRTDLAEKTDDIRTWSPNNYRDYITDMYLKSIQIDPKKYPTKDYEPIIRNFKRADISLRPTLYFLLLDRANTHFDYERFDGNSAVNRFIMQGEEYFAPFDSFKNMEVKSANEDAFTYRKVLMFQEAFQNAQNAEMKALYDIARLYFVYENIVDESEKDEWYKNALLHGEKSAPKAQKEHYSIPYVERLKNEGKNQEALDKIRDIEKYASENGKKRLANFKDAILQKTLYIRTKNVYSSNTELKFKISSKNLDKVTLKIAKINYVKFDEIKRYNKNIKYAIQKYKPEITKTITLNSGLDSKEDLIDLPALPYGHYIIYSETHGSFKYSSFRVSDLAVNKYKDDNNQMIVVRHRISGKPISNATVETYTQEWKNSEYKYNLSKSYKTNKDGQVLIKETGSKRIVVKKDKDEFVLEAYFSKDYSDYVKRGMVTIYTDRAIYRPGQTVYYKGIVTNFDQDEVPHLLKNHKVKVDFYDANGQEISTKNLETNEFGSVSGSFVIPKGNLTGEFRINMKGNLASGSRYVKVEEYKRPKFEVTFEDMIDSPKLNEKVVTKGQAKYLSGANVSNAKLSYRIVRNENSWYWWYRSEPVTIKQGEITTDKDGKFEIPFVATTDGKEGQFSYSVEVDVTDTNGETRSNTWSISLSSFPYRFTVDNLKNFDSRDQQKFIVKAQNAQYQSVEARAKIQIFENATESDVFDLFKNDDYYYYNRDREEENKLKRGKKVFEQEINLPKEGYTIAVNKLKGGRYIVVVTDSKNKDITYENKFSISNFNKGQFPDDELLTFCGTDGTYGVGENIDIEIGTAHPEVWVYYMWINEEDIIEEGWTTIDNVETISYTPKLKDKGGITLQLNAVKNNKVFTYNYNIKIPWTDKKLDVKLLTEKDKTQPGSEEKWAFEILGKDGKVNGEMLATMYDASLDQFVGHNYYYNVYPSHFGNIYNEFSGFGSTSLNELNYRWNRLKSRVVVTPTYPYLLSPNEIRRKKQESLITVRGMNRVDLAEESMVEDVEIAHEEVAYGADKSVALRGKVAGVQIDQAPSVGEVDDEGSDEETKKKDIPTRENLNETVFFYPHIPIKDGKAHIDFKMGDALTTWKLLTFAHDKDLRYGMVSHTIKTQKELMIQPNGPRFFREGDKIVFPATITNLTDKTLAVEAGMELESNGLSVAKAFGIKPIKKIQVPAGQSVKVAWEMDVPQDFKQLLDYKVWASSAKHQDAEKGMIPVLTNQKLINDTEIISLRSGEEKTIDLSDMSGNPYRFTFEYTSNPTWYAVQALPYMDEKGITITSIFNRYYTNKLARHIATSNPLIKKVIDRWREEGSDALISNLEKNTELKEMLLKETPWLRDAKDETEQKQRIVQLFDENNMRQGEQYALQQLISRQNSDGGWGWCYDDSSIYTTLRILDGIGRLKALGIQDFGGMEKTIDRALNYIDREIDERYDYLKKSVSRYDGNMKEDHLDYLSIYQLYVRRHYDNKWLPKSTDAYNYYFDQSAKYWLGKGIQAEGKIGLYLLERKDPEAQKIITSLEERSFYSDELGRYWNQGNGYHWYDLPIESHAQMIELFNKVKGKGRLVEDAKIWLLKNKETNNWGSYASTADAIYALLLDNGETKAGQWLGDKSLPKVYFDGKEQKFEEVEAGTGYFKVQYTGNDAKAKQPKKITIKNGGKTIGWGAAYVQHFEALDKVKANRDNPLNIRKKLYLEVTDDNGTRLEEVKDAGLLKIGDRVITRIEIKTDRSMDYVTLKDMRPSGFEPENVISQYKWNHGLGYYESTRDLASHFFISHLRKGTYVFEYPQRVVHEGNYSSGISIIQSEYAPEFTSHSEGVRVNVE